MKTYIQLSRLNIEKRPNIIVIALKAAIIKLTQMMLVVRMCICVSQSASVSVDFY